MTAVTKTFVLDDQVRMVIPPNYIPADHSKDVSGIVGKVTNIDKHFEYEDLWLYAVTFPRYHQYQVFNQAIPPIEIEEEITLTFWNEQIELIDVESDIRQGECVECGRFSSQLTENGYCEGCVMQAAIDAQERLK